MTYLAYDGSLNGDWVARYATHLAAQTPERTLTVVHVRDGSLDEDELERKLERLRRECQGRGVDLIPELPPLRKNVLQTLLGAISGEPESIVVCGTRVRGARKPFLAGTIAEKLLQVSPLPVLALRVVQPGLLGAPRHLLLPLAGHPRGFNALWPFFRLFLPDLDTVHLLRGVVVGSLRLRHLSPEQHRALREHGVRYLAAVLEEIRQRRGGNGFRLDSRIIVCDDWVGEILVHASRLKSSLILLGASERSRLHRLLHGNEMERLLRGTPCDVGIYRWP